MKTILLNFENGDVALRQTCWIQEAQEFNDANRPSVKSEAVINEFGSSVKRVEYFQQTPAEIKTLIDAEHAAAV